MGRFPDRPVRRCTTPGCPNLATDDRLLCPRHRLQAAIARVVHRKA